MFDPHKEWITSREKENLFAVADPQWFKGAMWSFLVNKHLLKYWFLYFTRVFPFPSGGRTFDVLLKGALCNFFFTGLHFCICKHWSFCSGLPKLHSAPLSKSSNTTVKKYSVTSKNHALKFYCSKITKVKLN